MSLCLRESSTCFSWTIFLKENQVFASRAFEGGYFTEGEMGIYFSVYPVS